MAGDFQRMAVKAALVLLAGWAAIVLAGADANTMAEMGPDAAPAPRWQSAVEVEQEEARPRAHSNSAAASREPSEIAENTVSADTPARTPPNTDQDASEPSQPTEEPAGAESESAAAESQAQAHQQAAQPESQSAPDPEQEAPRTDNEAREDGDSSTQTTYTWRDGEHSRTVTYQAELTVVTSREGESEIVPRQAASAQSDGPPVFRSDTGELMTLPGGVLLVLDADSDQSRIDQFFAVNGISRGRVHDQTFTTNAFLIDTEPGLPSLNLAIQLAGQEGVVIASPNWEREATPQASDSLMPLLEPRSVEALADCAKIDRSAGIDDPYYGCQWHLKNTGQFTDAVTSMPDIRVEDVWDASDPETMGEGIRVAVVDSGMHSAHEDLSMNVDTSRNHNYRNGDTNISGSRAGHGTSVAGIIAARDNSVGVRGVAPRATIYGYNLIAGSTVPDANVADAMTRDLADTAVSNNSWGFGRTGAPVRAHATWEAAVVNGVENGFGGKGVVYVWAGGNSYRESDHANLDGQANHYATTAVCAVNYKDVRSYYSELGANLWVCGLSGNVASGRRNYLHNPDGHLQPITTTDNGNRYRETFSGTSAAAPIVSGVVALMRAANDQLTWRDVKVILANSARKNDPGNSGWLSGAAKYRSPMESYSYNLAYGFGVVDAKAAVDLAKTWTNLPPWRTTRSESADEARGIPDAPSNSVPGSTIESTLTVDDYVRFVEFVEINVNMVHSQFKDLAIELVSPSGNVSTLTTARRKAGSAGINGSYRFGSARHLGESPAGTWKLRVTDRRAGNSGTLRSWNVTVYGYGPTLTLSLPTPGDQSITAHWMDPDDQGGSDSTSYDLRFIRSDASDKSDLRWTTRTDIATDTYEITGLEAGVYYDIQVRAHNDLGAGSWTITVQGSTSPVAPETLAAPNVSGRAGELRVSWTPPRAGQVGILRYGLRYILSSDTAEEKEDGDNWTEEVAWTTGGGELKHIIDGLTNGVSYDVQARAVNSQGTSEWSSTSAGAPFIANAEPAFPMSETGIRSVSENTPAGQNIGAAIRAIDPNGDNLTYESASLDFKHFAIDESSGQIQTKKPLNHEDKSSYTFAVSVSDQKDVNAEADTTSDDTIVVTVTVEDVNEPPVVTGDMEHDITENSGRYVADFNATDPENDVLEWRLSGPDADHFEVSDSGALSFVANPDYDAFADADTDSAYEVFVEAYEVPVEASDGSLAGRIEVTINILDVNEPLVAEDDSVTVVEDTRTYLNVLANDNDPESADLTVTAPASTDNASLVVQPGGLIRYSPNPNFDKQDRFTYQISDGTDRASATVIVTIEPVNDAPVFPAGAMQLEVAKDAQEGDKVGQPVTATDVEGGRLTYRLIGNNFPFEIDTSSGQILVGPGASFDPTVQDTYTVAVRARDPGFAKSDILVIITVVDQGVNEAPVASDDAATTREDEAVVVPVLDNDRDPENDDLAVIRVTAPQNGAAEVDAGGETITYTPRLNHHGADSFTYTVSDGHLDGQAEVSVTIRSVNDAPAFAAVPAARSVSENAPGAKVGVPVIATDVDDITLTYRLQGAPEFEIVEDTGQIQVAPGVTLDRERTPSYEVTVTASDGKGGTDSITVTINVSNVNEAPTAVNDTATTDEDQSVRIDVLDNDTDPDTERAALTVSVLRDPLDGTARVESDRTITYTPNANFAGENSFTYSVSDGSLSDAGSVTVTVEAVNDAPAFPAATAERTVSEQAKAGDPVGAALTATDVDGDTLTYGLTGAAASDFEIDEQTGQITVAEGAALNVALSPYTVTVTADDRQGETAMVEVTITVTAGPVIIITGGGGGGGGPSPSEVDFEWTVQHDIEELDGGNDRATGMWSDGTTLWVADNADGAGDAVYAYDRESGERVEEREFALHETNRAPRGFWSDRSVVWVSDSGRERLFAYDLATGERLEEREFALAAGNSDARGIWSDEETMWVLDGRTDALFAYALASGELLAEYALDSANDDPRGIWSDGVTIWVSDHGAKRLIAYRLPVLPDTEADSGEEDADGDARELERVSDEEFTELSKASNNSPRGIWSDGDVMYVADESDDRVYSYNMPDAIDARLASLTLSGVGIGEFSSSNTEYEAVVADGVTETTVEAEAMQRRTDVAIDPPDADVEADGHQVALHDLGEITVTVTSQDGSRTRVYRVRFPDTGWDPARDPWPHCLRGAVSEGFSLVVYEGGSVDELVSCAESRGIVALYAPHEGVYVSHILGAPDFVNREFREIFADGLPVMVPLVAGSNGPPSADPFGDLDDGGQQPWPECLRGDGAAGFSLVVYEGGSVEELVACARSVDITALYTLSEGDFVSYILGAPDFVTQPFRDLFAGGLPLMTPLVARSEGQPGGR